MKAIVTDMTVSLKLSDKEYGNGPEGFANLAAKFPEGVEISEMDDAVVVGLEMFQRLWKTVLIQRFASGHMNGEDLEKKLVAMEKRFKRAIEGVKSE